MYIEIAAIYWLIVSTVVDGDDENLWARQKRQGLFCDWNKCYERRGPPVCLNWCLIPSPTVCCQQPRYECCKYKEKQGYCPATKRTCEWPYPVHVTDYYRCPHDFTCPVGFKCCQDPCYFHRICKPIVAGANNKTTESTGKKPAKEGKFRHSTEKTTRTTTERTTTAETKITPKPTPDSVPWRTGIAGTKSLSVSISVVTELPPEFDDKESKEEDENYYYDESYYQ